MKYLLYGLLCLFLLVGGCVHLDTAPSEGGLEPVKMHPFEPDMDLPERLEHAVSAYLDCTAEAAVDTVLDGASLAQAQLFLVEQCNNQKIAVLAGMQPEGERETLAQKLKEWDLATINAVRNRLGNLENLLEVFMDCGYANVKDVLSREHERSDEAFLEGLVMKEIAACYDTNLGAALHPALSMQSPVGLARKDRVMLIAKDRIMQELYDEIKREEESRKRGKTPGRSVPGEVMALL